MTPPISNSINKPRSIQKQCSGDIPCDRADFPDGPKTFQVAGHIVRSRNPRIDIGDSIETSDGLRLNSEESRQGFITDLQGILGVQSLAGTCLPRLACFFTLRRIIRNSIDVARGRDSMGDHFEADTIRESTLRRIDEAIEHARRGAFLFSGTTSMIADLLRQVVGQPMETAREILAAPSPNVDRLLLLIQSIPFRPLPQRVRQLSSRLGGDFDTTMQEIDRLQIALFQMALRVYSDRARSILRQRSATPRQYAIAYRLLTLVEEGVIRINTDRGREVIPINLRSINDILRRIDRRIPPDHPARRIMNRSTPARATLGRPIQVGP